MKLKHQLNFLYPIDFAENQIKFGRFIFPYNISLYLKDIIMINKVYAVLINKDNNEQDDTIEFTFDEETKSFSLKNPIEKAGNYQLSIINKYDSTDFIDYPFVIYDTINLEKKYIPVNNTISVTYPTNIVDILLNNISIAQILNVSETSIDILINRTGINTITLLLPNNTLYEVGNITAIPDNYFQINYTKCITGKNFPNEFELTIITRTTSRIIDLSYFYLSY